MFCDDDAIEAIQRTGEKRIHEFIVFEQNLFPEEKSDEEMLKIKKTLEEMHVGLNMIEYDQPDYLSVCMGGTGFMSPITLLPKFLKRKYRKIRKGFMSDEDEDDASSDEGLNEDLNWFEDEDEDSHMVEANKFVDSEESRITSLGSDEEVNEETVEDNEEYRAKGTLRRNRIDDNTDEEEQKPKKKTAKKVIYQETDSGSVSD